MEERAAVGDGVGRRPTPAAGGFVAFPQGSIAPQAGTGATPGTERKSAASTPFRGSFSTRKGGSLTYKVWPPKPWGREPDHRRPLANSCAIRRTKPRDKQQRSSRIALGGPVEVEASEPDVKVAQAVREVDGVPVDPCHGTILPRSWSRGPRSWPGPRAPHRGSSTCGAPGTRSKVSYVPAAAPPGAARAPGPRRPGRSKVFCVPAVTSFDSGLPANSGCAVRGDVRSWRSRITVRIFNVLPDNRSGPQGRGNCVLPAEKKRGEGLERHGSGSSPGR